MALVTPVTGFSTSVACASGPSRNGEYPVARTAWPLPRMRPAVRGVDGDPAVRAAHCVMGLRTGSIRQELREMCHRPQAPRHFARVAFRSPRALGGRITAGHNPRGDSRVPRAPSGFAFSARQPLHPDRLPAARHRPRRNGFAGRAVSAPGSADQSRHSLRRALGLRTVHGSRPAALGPACHRAGARGHRACQRLLRAAVSDRRRRHPDGCGRSGGGADRVWFWGGGRASVARVEMVAAGGCILSLSN